MNGSIETTHYISLSKYPGAYLAALIANDDTPEHDMYGIGDTIPDALSALERKTKNNLAATLVRLPNGTTYGIAYSLMAR